MIWAKIVGGVFIGRSLESKRAPIIQKRVQIDYGEKRIHFLYYVHDRRVLFFLNWTALNGHINSGMKDFRDFAEGRAIRIYNEVFSLFPLLKDFASGVKINRAADYVEPIINEIAPMLGLKNINPEPPQIIKLDFEDNKLEAVYIRAKKSGVLSELKDIVEVSQRLDLYARPYKRAVMFTPQDNKSKMLFTVWTLKDEIGSLFICISHSKIHEYFPRISEEQAGKLGAEEWHKIRANEVGDFLKNLEELFGAH